MASRREDGSEIKRIRVTAETPLAPRESEVYRWERLVKLFDSADNELYETPKSELVFELSVDSVKFGDAEVLKLYRSGDDLF